MNNSEIKVGNQQNKGNSLFLYLVFLIIGLLVILLLIFLIQYLRLPCGDEGKMTFLDYLFGLDIVASPCNPCEEPEPPQEECPDGVCENEIFNISDQIYTFPQAVEKCRAYGSELASYEQLMDHFNKGGQFLNYGWSKSPIGRVRKNAYYVVQPCDFVKMRKKGVNIGGPGVPGGLFNPKLKFGANCYGKRPPGMTVKPKSKCCGKKPSICQKNPFACKKSDKDGINPFYKGKYWSECDI